MRILFFTNEYSHPELPPHGGVGTFFKTVAERLTAQGHEVFIYGFSKRKYEIIDDEIKIKFFKQYFKANPIAELFRSLSSRLGYPSITEYWLKKERQHLTKQLKKYALKNNIDIIQSFTFNGFTAFWDNSIPLVTRYHGSRGFWHYYLNKPYEELKIKMEKKALLVTPFTVANSYFSKDFIKDYYDIEVAKVIPNGIDVNHFSPKKDVEEIPKSIFYVGTISEAKGVNNLISAFNEIIKKHPDATLHLIGRGEKYFNQLKSKLFTEAALVNTTYYKHISLKELPRKLSEASLIAVPSKGETFGFTIVEAMALEKITVVSDIPVAHEIIEDTKDGFIAKDTKHFEELICKVFDHPEAFSTMRKVAREKVLANYTLELMTKATLNYYKEILKTEE
ncbi:MAG: glycosyltransferase family 4 protein [Winogradskyella sp.]|uniref:glycosyltransferase family 4 protein n=1 Tax=Winogradskyella sp. TaxID=1883156 RepID=UPI0025F558D3|nr:glycosyltransferase family 4 protein [Winogradskyella sp.]NRB58541.1 glycosyltransferase family 4 protein [Winogradskyella sp.]